MAEPLSRDDVAYIAHLARLELSDAELDAFTPQLAGILDFAAQIEALDTEGVEPMSHPLPIKNVFRPDEVTPSLERDLVLSMAPDAEDGQFKVPRILSEEP